MYKRLVSYDFDGTLCFTPEPNEGKQIWFEKTGNVFPYPGWWSKKESLDMKVFYIPTNPFVVSKYKEDIRRSTETGDTYVFLATGRIEKLKKEVSDILEHHNLFFDSVHLNTGGDTLSFKKKLFESLINKFNPEVFVMYDDRHEHIVEFIIWAKSQPCRIEIIDVTKSDKTPITIN
jgi:hypothetical protein